MKKPSSHPTSHLLLAALAGAVITALVIALTLYLTMAPWLGPILQSRYLIHSRFVEDYDADTLLDGALTGMVISLGDRWSHYLDPVSAELQKQRQENTFDGIGILVNLQSSEEGLLIQEVYPDTPAERAGLKAGDLILSADGRSIEDTDTNTLFQLIAGVEGSQVTLSVCSPGQSPRQLTLTREKMERDPVHSRMLDGQVGYIALENFYSHSADRLIEAVDEMIGQGAQALIFDMRNNGGGYVSELTKMLDHLLPEGPIFRSVDASGQETVTTSDAACVSLPMAVLVNADTYSAAEFFAAQLQEMAGAPIVGEPTSGKGYSQQPFALANGGILQISTARYLTGNGISLIGTGLMLDRTVSLPTDTEPFVDTQLNAALELLNKPTLPN